MIRGGAGNRRDRRHVAGISLVEMVTVIALTGVLSVGLAGILQHPMQGYLAVSRRTELVSIANLAMNRMTRDLRRSLPNSVRVGGGGRALELMSTLGGGRYRAEVGINDPGGPNEEDHRDASDVLSFGGDAQWNVIGRLQAIDFAYGNPLAAGTRAAIYPTSVDVWNEAATGAEPGVITPAGTTIQILDDGDEDQIRLGSSYQFRYASPTGRLFLVEGPVTYVCDLTSRSLWRVEGYSVASSQPTNVLGAPLSGGQASLAAQKIEACAFQYVAGSATRAGLVTVEIVLEEADERIRLLQQIQVQNAP